MDNDLSMLVQLKSASHKKDNDVLSYYRNVDNIACCVYSVRKDGTMHKSKGVTPM